MSSTPYSLAANGHRFFQDWTDIGLITADDDWSNVPGIVGYRGDDLTTATGTDARTILGTSPVIDVIANQTSPNTNTSGGVAEFQIANPVIALQGSGTADAPYVSLYLDTTGEETITFSTLLRDIDGSTDNAAQQIAVQYRIGTGAWTNVAYVADASTGPSLATAQQTVSVVLPADANNQPLVEVRVLTTNAVGNDEWIGVDDITVTSQAITVAQPGNFSIADATVTEGGPGTTTDMVFTVSRGGGSSGAASIGYTVALPGTNGRAAPDDFVAGTATSGTLSFAAGETSKTITLTVTGDARPEPNETFAVTLGTPSAGAISRGTATGMITNDDGTNVAIYDIQGIGHRSGFTGQQVTTAGIVTAVDTNGFYLQSAVGDGDSRTSDAIFVFTSTPPTGVAVGNAITLGGTVSEFVSGTGGLTVTELTAPTAITVTAANVPLPDAVIIATDGTGRAPPTEKIASDGFATYDPTLYGADFYESLEGMRVTIKVPLVVADTNSFGETYVVASGGAGATGINDRGGITLSAGDDNPERIQIDDDAGIFAGYTPAHTQGDVLSDVTGILNYSFAQYEVLVTAPVTTTKDVTLAREATNLVGTASALSYASFNVENLSPTNPDSKYQALATEIVTALKSPDIIGLEEIQDADGNGTGTDLSGQVTAQKVIDAIAAAGGPVYRYVEVAPTATNISGGEPNGNIRNGFLYNTARVAYVDGSARVLNDAAYAGTRKPLIADFLFNGQLITAADMHSTSRGGSDPALGANQPATQAADSARTAQAVALKGYIDGVLATDPTHKFVVNGDFNGYYYEAALQALAAGGTLANLYDKLPVNERYSYQFEGTYQAFDNILVSGALSAGSAFDVVHYNAGFADGLAVTDHDQVVATIGLARSAGPATAVADSFATTSYAVYRGTVLANDTGGGGGLVVASANGVAAGTQQRLASGALLTVQADGSFVYDPDGAFSAIGTGQTTTDSFTYALSSGASAAVSVTVSGYTSGRDTPGDDIILGTSRADNLSISSGGDDILRAGAGDDTITIGGTLTASDRIDGGSGLDRLNLTGEYTGVNRLVLSATTLTNIELINLGSGNYDIVSNDATVAKGTRLNVFGEGSLTFDGSAETDGSFSFAPSGGGVDHLIGGAGNDYFYAYGGADVLTGGKGNDIFITGLEYKDVDTITDFSVGDKIRIYNGNYNSSYNGSVYGLSYTHVGSSLQITNNPDGSSLKIEIGASNFRVIKAPAGGIDLIAANRYTGLTDFDGNGHSDILFRNDDGTFSTWNTSGNVIGNQFQVNATFTQGVATSWHITETLDFDGDGRSDILWRNDDGRFTIWTGTGSGWVENAYSNGYVGTDWKIAGTGDFNGDGKDDLVWRQDSGAYSTWTSTGTQFQVNTTFGAVGTDWKIVGTADFDGDGKDDLLWRNATSGEFTEWRSTGTGFTPNVYTNGFVGTDWHIDAMADFNGDGKDDLLWRHDGDGTFTVWQSTGDGFAVNAYVDASVGTAWQVAAAADFNDDGKADILWRNAATGEFTTWQSNGNGFDVNTAFVSGVADAWHIQAHDYVFG